MVMIGDPDGSGSGSGSGYGYGSGSGYGYGYGSGSGSGDGDGYGSGYGSGDGYGYGSGYGSGDGDGDGSGYGSGSGDGSGYGYGSGSGYGYGSGYGSGYGYGDGDKEKYFLALRAPFEKANITTAFWRSTRDGKPANGGTGTQAVVGLHEQIPGPLQLCCKQALHATHHPEKWKGERWWLVALHHPIQTQDHKLGSLQRTILADLGHYPFIS